MGGYHMGIGFDSVDWI